MATRGRFAISKLPFASVSTGGRSPPSPSPSSRASTVIMREPLFGAHRGEQVFDRLIERDPRVGDRLAVGTDDDAADRSVGPLDRERDAGLVLRRCRA